MRLTCKCLNFIMADITGANDMKMILRELSNEYDSLTEQRSRLEEECKSMQQYIQTQVQHINGINEEIMKLRNEYQEQIQIQNYKKDEQQGESSTSLTLLIDESSIRHPATISPCVEICDNSVICSTAFSPNGANLAIGSEKFLRVYNFENDCFVLEAPFDDQFYIRSITWTPDSSKVIAGAENQSIYIFDISPENKSPDKNPSTPTDIIQTNAGEVFQVKCFKDGTRLAASLGDGTVQIWDLNTKQKISSFIRGPDKQAITISISDDDKIIATGYMDGYIAFWDVDKQKMLFEQECHSQGVYSCLLLPKFNRLATSSLDTTVKLWDITENGLTLWKTLDKHTQYVLSLALDPTQNWMISGSKDMTCIFTSLEEGEMIYQLKGHENSVMTVSFSPTGHMFCSGSGDMFVKVWTFTPESAKA